MIECLAWEGGNPRYFIALLEVDVDVGGLGGPSLLSYSCQITRVMEREQQPMYECANPRKNHVEDSEAVESITLSCYSQRDKLTMERISM